MGIKRQTHRVRVKILLLRCSTNVRNQQRKTWGWNFYRLLSHYGKHISPQFDNSIARIILLFLPQIRSLTRLVVDFFLCRKCGKHIPIICLLSSHSIFFFYFLFGLSSSLRFGWKFVEKKANGATSKRKTIELCEWVCVSYNANISSLSLSYLWGSVFFGSFYLSFFRPSFSNVISNRCFIFHMIFYSIFSSFRMMHGVCGTQWQCMVTLTCHWLYHFECFILSLLR